LPALNLDARSLPLAGALGDADAWRSYNSPLTKSARSDSI